MPKLKVFLSGGMSDIPEKDSKKWRRLFKQAKHINVSSAYYAEQYSFINPTTLYKPSKPYDPTLEKEAMAYDLFCVKQADVIVVNFNSLSSIGTAQELMLAYTLNKPIIGMIEKNKYEQLHPWYKQECIKIFTYTPDKLEDTINEIIEYVWRFKND